MKDGYLRVGADCPPLLIADCAANAVALADAARRAAGAGVRVLVFPELSLSAYTCGDLFLSAHIVAAAEQALSDYIRRTADLDLLSFVGLPVACNDKLFNCAAAVCRGQLLGLIPKTHLPNYAEFYEARHFAPAPEGLLPLRFAGQDTRLGTRQIFVCREMPVLRVACEICEDLWVSIPPSCLHAEAGATLIVNPSASDEVIGKSAYRRQLVAMQSARTLSAYVYADAGEGESGTDMVFSGHHLIAQNGHIAAERPPFTGDTLLFSEVDLDLLSYERRRTSTFTALSGDTYVRVPFSLTPEKTALSSLPSRHPFVPEDPARRAERCEAILTMQACGLAGRIDRAHARTAVIGISGGLDSTLALLASCRAFDRLGRERRQILAVTMPCFGTTARTRGNAEVLCEELGVSLRVVDIRDAVRGHFRDIGQPEDRLDVVYENAQARERTQILMDLANAEGGLVVGTGDLSELALGWATYNGDHMSMYAPNASVPKTLVRYLVAYAADQAEANGQLRVAAVLRDILDTPVSPELLPPSDGEIAQKTEDLVGPYELHDFFLYYFLRCGFRPRKILRLSREVFRGVYEDRVILHWLRTFLRRFFTQQFKRSCLPDGPKVGTVALSPRGDWRMPSDASPDAFLAELSGAEEEF